MSVWVFLLTLGASLVHSQAAAPPAANLTYTAPNNAVIHGGVAMIGNNGTIYFSMLSTSGTRANVTALTSTGALKWTPFTVGDGAAYNMYAAPAIAADVRNNAHFHVRRIALYIV